MNTEATSAPEIVIHRGHDGKGAPRAKTKIDLGLDRRVLLIETSKAAFGPGLRCEARGSQITEDGLSEIYSLGNFSERLVEIPGARATEKAIRELHECALRDVKSVVERATAHYQQRITKAT